MKRLIDIVASFTGLLLLSPLIMLFMFLIFIQDWNSPFYIAPRVGKDFKGYRMFKLRSMIANADKSGVDSTSANDNRITWIGHLIRKLKLDELTQLINVFIGDMSLVGPRPNVKREVDLYTEQENILLSVRPGITDISSIVFSDEGEILAVAEDPDLRYNQIIRPWKSRLGLIYIENASFTIDIKLIFVTIVAIVNKPVALKWVARILARWEVDEILIKMALRDGELIAFPPPGATHIVEHR
jgi:lipopolysaccharide/colanic/teichoic acid biosynthesis glycosyltransferase